MTIVGTLLVFVCIAISVMNLKDLKVSLSDYQTSVKEYREGIGRYDKMKTCEKEYYRASSVLVFFVLLAAFITLLII